MIKLDTKDKITLVATATMGVESVVKFECENLGFKDIKTLNGRCEFSGDVKSIVVANINLRCADRVFLKMGEFRATTFEELFQNIKKLGWEKILPKNANFPISWVSSVKSKLFSKSDIQRITKKAIVEKMKYYYDIDDFPEDGAKYAIKIQANKDNFIVMIDTSGEGLHKRGYRAIKNEAPIKETLAAALVYLSKWQYHNKPLFDPMCGTGTILIEAAMIGRNIAPGSNRNFVSEKWDIIPENYWLDARDEAYSREDFDKVLDIIGSDVDAKVIEIAKNNAVMAGVEDDIKFSCVDFLDADAPSDFGDMITNPPYGDRLLDDEKVQKLYSLLGEMCRIRLPHWSYFIITSYPEFQKYFGKKANKNRKLYNGGIECHYYQYYAKNGEKNEK